MKSKEEIVDFLGSIPYINSGGCLLAAYAFWLHELKAKRANCLHIVELSYSERSLEYNRLYLQGEEGYVHAESNAHFGWTYNSGQTVYDCKGFVSKYSARQVIPFHKTSDFCISALNYGDWNSMFPRKQFLPTIAEFTGVDLSAIKTVPIDLDDSRNWDYEDLDVTSFFR